MIRSFSAAVRAGEEGAYTRLSLFFLEVLFSAAAIDVEEEEEEGEGSGLV